MKKRKEITNKLENELSNYLNFHGKYVDSLIKAANRTFDSEYTTVKECLKHARKEQKETLKIRAKSFGISVKKMKTLQEKCIDFLSDFHTGHSMGCYRKVILQRYGKEILFAENNRLFDYANSCKWSPTYGEIAVRLSIKEIESLENKKDENGIRTWFINGREVIENGKKHSYFLNW